MKKVSFEEIERLGERVKAQNGDCIVILNDGQSDETQCMIHCHNNNSVIGLLASFFQCNPNLVSTALHAIAMSMECEDCQLCDYDDGEDEPDEDAELCMN